MLIIRNKFVVALFVFLLVIVILFNFGISPFVEAKAFAITAGCLAFCATLLVGSGIVFASVDSLQVAAGKLWRDGTEAWQKTVSTMAVTIGATATLMGVPASFLKEAVSSIQTTYAVDQTFINAGVDVTVPISFPPNSVGASSVLHPDSYKLAAQYTYFLVVNSSRADVNQSSIEVYYSNAPLTPIGSSYDASVPSRYIELSNILDTSVLPVARFYSLDGGSNTSLLKHYDTVRNCCFVSENMRDLITNSPNFSYYDAGVQVQVPVTDLFNQGATIPYTAAQAGYVDGTLTKGLDDVLTKNPTASVDILFNPTIGELVGDVPRDVIKDKTLVDAMDKAGTIDIPTTIPKLGDLEFPKEIVSVFPFCIPFDLARGVDILCAPPVAPRFEIPLKYGTILNEKIVIEFSQFDYVIRFIRWAEIFGFTLGLAVLTRKVIKW